MRKIICKDTGEVVYSYQDYLKTEHWLNIRADCLSGCGYVCMGCKAKNRSLQVHHLHYETLGNETRKDLIPLCDSCHSREHENEEDRNMRLSKIKRRLNKEIAEVKNHKIKRIGRVHYTRYVYKDGTKIALCIEDAVKKDGFAIECNVTRAPSLVTCKLCLSKLRKINWRKH